MRMKVIYDQVEYRLGLNNSWLLCYPIILFVEVHLKKAPIIICYRQPQTIRLQGMRAGNIISTYGRIHPDG